MTTPPTAADAAPPRPIPTLEDRMTAPDRIPVDCIRLGCGNTAGQHHRMAGDTADTRSQDRAIRELTAELDEAREQAADAAYAAQQARKAVTQLRAELRAAQEQIAMHSTPADEQTTEPDDDADLADALERAESGRIDRDDSVWWPRADGLWTTRYLEPLTLDRLEALFGPTRAVLLVDIEQDDDEPAPPSLGSPADRAQDERPDCPICSGPVRETVGMVCRTCGTDCAPADRAQDGIRPAAWEQHVVDAVRAALVDALPPLAAAPEADRTATVAVRAIIDAGLAGDELWSTLGPAERAEG